MTTYNFDQTFDLRGTDSAKWNYFSAETLPMWVAEMDFQSANPIIDAVQKRVARGLFGYGMESDTLRETLVERMGRLYGWSIRKEEIVFLPGLVCGLNVVSRAIGAAGDGVLIQPPVYPPFLIAPLNQDREVHEAPMAVSLHEGNLYYETDTDAMEAAVRPNTQLYMMCNPHNPVGRAFRREELTAIAEVCERHDLIICSDEIHCDLLMGDSRHIPMASLAPEVANRTITLMAPSKSFNVPGLGCAFAIIPNLELRKQVTKAATGIVPHVNILGMVAAEAAYTHGDEWLVQTLAYLTANRDFALDFIRREMPTLRTTNPEATYLLWLDCREALGEANPQKFFLEQAKLAVNDGATFGNNGKGFIRVNYACARSTLEQGLQQMKAALAGLAVSA